MSDQRTELFEQMKKVIASQLDVAESEVHEKALFVDDLGADSLALVELVLALEDGFGVTIPDTVADRLQTVGDAVTYVLQHRDATKERRAGAA